MYLAEKEIIHVKWLRECYRQGEAEVVRNSGNKFTKPRTSIISRPSKYNACEALACPVAPLAPFCMTQSPSRRSTKLLSMRYAVDGLMNSVAADSKGISLSYCDFVSFKCQSRRGFHCILRSQVIGLLHLPAGSLQFMQPPVLTFA